jgi:DNA-binding GntR family transcriptional regulator
VLGDGKAVQLTRNANGVAADLIREAILDGRIPAGARLKEGELAQQLRISRTPIREALLVLQAQGLVELTPNHGASVRRYSLEELDDMYHVRALLEGLAARLAATRLATEALEQLSASCERFASIAPDDVEGLVKENMVFHTTVLDGAGRPRLTEMARNVIELPLVYRVFHWYSPERKQASLHYHEELTSALEARDAERSELVMRAHVLAARETLIAHLRTVGDVNPGLLDG